MEKSASFVAGSEQNERNAKKFHSSFVIKERQLTSKNIQRIIDSHDAEKHKDDKKRAKSALKRGGKETRRPLARTYFFNLVALFEAAEEATPIRRAAGPPTNPAAGVIATRPDETKRLTREVSLRRRTEANSLCRSKGEESEN